MGGYLTQAAISLLTNRLKDEIINDLRGRVAHLGMCGPPLGTKCESATAYFVKEDVTAQSSTEPGWNIDRRGM